MALLGSLFLFTLFGLANLGVGLAAAGFFGMGPWKSSRFIRFVSEPVLAPPLVFSGTWLRLQITQPLTLLRLTLQQRRAARAAPSEQAADNVSP